MRLRRRNAQIRRRNEVELEEQRRRYRGFYRSPSPVGRNSRPKNRTFLAPSLPIDQKKKSSPVAGTSGIRQLPKPQVPVRPPAPIRPPAPQAQQRLPALHVQQPGRPQQQNEHARPPVPRQDPLQRANEAWQNSGSSQNICLKFLNL